MKCPSCDGPISGGLCCRCGRARCTIPTRFFRASTALRTAAHAFSRSGPNFCDDYKALLRQAGARRSRGPDDGHEVRPARAFDRSMTVLRVKAAL